VTVRVRTPLSKGEKQPLRVRFRASTSPVDLRPASHFWRCIALAIRGNHSGTQTYEAACPFCSGNRAEDWTGA
jgi:hypothetical protein